MERGNLLSSLTGKEGRRLTGDYPREVVGIVFLLALVGVRKRLFVTFSNCPGLGHFASTASNPGSPYL